MYLFMKPVLIQFNSFQSAPTVMIYEAGRVLVEPMQYESKSRCQSDPGKKNTLGPCLPYCNLWYSNVEMDGNGTSPIYGSSYSHKPS